MSLEEDMKQFMTARQKLEAVSQAAERSRTPGAMLSTSHALLLQEIDALLGRQSPKGEQETMS